MLPTGYTRLEYIESTGTQYINTGFKPNQDTRVVMDFQFASEYSSLGANEIFGTRTSASSKTYAIQWNTANNYFQHFYYNGYDNLSFGDFEKRQIAELNRNMMYLDGVAHERTYAAFQCDYPLYLSALNQAGTTNYFAAIRIYSCKIYDNGALVRNYIPAKNSSGVIGLYDDANAKFYTNAGTGKFVAGAEIAAPTLYALSESAVTIQWGAISGAANYHVYRDKAYIATTAGTTWTDNTVSPYSRYLYHIEADDYVSDALAVETPGTTLPELITDRTQTDVATAKQILGKLLAGEQLTYAERRAYDAGLRGCYNASDATRVELHTRRLQRLFNDNGYNVQIDTRMWSKAEVMRYDDAVRYLANIQTLVDIFGKSANAPDVPDISRWIDHIAANDIESVLLDLSELASGAIAMFRISGTFAAGNDYIMQIIRR